MPLNINAQTTQAGQNSAAAVVPQTIKLELAFYERYSRGSVLYTKKTDDGLPRAYIFDLKQASQLLQEVDEVSGRPIWMHAIRRETPAEIEKRRATARVFDATKDKIAPMKKNDLTEVHGVVLDVGTDDELRELLGDEAADVIPEEDEFNTRAHAGDERV